MESTEWTNIWHLADCLSDHSKRWTIDRDTAGHGGRRWKLKDKSGDRVASLGEHGEVLGK